MTGFVSFILKAVQGRFVIPDFCMFAEETQKLFIKCKQLSSVEVCNVSTSQLGCSDMHENIHAVYQDRMKLRYKMCC